MSTHRWWPGRVFVLPLVAEGRRRTENGRPVPRTGAGLHPTGSSTLPEADRESAARFGGIGRNAQFNYCRSTMGANCPTGELSVVLHGGGCLAKDYACGQRLDDF